MGSYMQGRNTFFTGFDVDTCTRCQQLIEALDSYLQFGSHMKCCSTALSSNTDIRSCVEQPIQVLKSAPKGSYHQRCDAVIISDINHFFFGDQFFQTLGAILFFNGVVFGCSAIVVNFSKVSARGRP